jgi:hypothetical protein
MSLQTYSKPSGKLKGLPRGIIQDNSDLELRPLWLRSNSRSKVRTFALFVLLCFSSVEAVALHRPS